MYEPPGTPFPSSPSAKKKRPTVQHRIDAALTEERARIARELHDELGSALTAARLELAAIRRSTGHLDAETARRMSHLNDVLARCMPAMRLLVRSLWPTPQAGVTLADALKGLCLEFEASQGLRIELRFVGARRGQPLPPAHAHTAHRLVQEALTNVAAHAACDQAWVIVSVNASALRVSVRDRGRGFDPAALPSHTHGLAGMRARVAALHGRLELRSAPGAGTLVRAVLPLPDASA
jgi:signal transduction histidine kinase